MDFIRIYPLYPGRIVGVLDITATSFSRITSL